MVGDLGRCAGTAVWHRGVDLRSGGTASRRPADTTLVRTRAGSAGRGLAWEPIRSGSLLVGLLERRLLLRRWRRGWWRASWHARSRLRHLVLRPRRLLILGRRLGRQPTTLTTLACHNSAKKIVTQAEGRGWRARGGTAVLRGAGKAWLGSTATALLKLAA